MHTLLFMIGSVMLGMGWDGWMGGTDHLQLITHTHIHKHIMEHTARHFVCASLLLFTLITLLLCVGLLPETCNWGGDDVTLATCIWKPRVKHQQNGRMSIVCTNEASLSLFTLRLMQKSSDNGPWFHHSSIAYILFVALLHNGYLRYHPPPPLLSSHYHLFDPKAAFLHHVSILMRLLLFWWW